MIRLILHVGRSVDYDEGFSVRFPFAPIVYRAHGCLKVQGRNVPTAFLLLLDKIQGLYLAQFDLFLFGAVHESEQVVCREWLDVLHGNIALLIG